MDALRKRFGQPSKTACVLQGGRGCACHGSQALPRSASPRSSCTGHGRSRQATIAISTRQAKAATKRASPSGKVHTDVGSVRVSNAIHLQAHGDRPDCARCCFAKHGDHDQGHAQSQIRTLR